MKLVGAALDQHVGRHTARQPLIGVEGARRHADRFDGFERRNIRRDVRQPQVVRNGAFDANGVGVAGRAVRAERQTARRVDGHRVHVLRRRDARDGDEQTLIVASDRHGQILELRRRYVGADVGAIGLQHGDAGGHRHGVRHLTDLESGADAHDAVFSDTPRPS